MSGAATPSYRDFVVPGHPVIGALLGAPPRRDAGTAGTAAAVEAALATARRRLRYEPTPGRNDLAEIGRRAAAAGGEPVVLNCIDGVCAVAAHLRAGGFGADEVWVAVGGLASPIGADLGAEFHAWLAVLLEPGRLLWIDPVHWTSRRAEGAEILAEHRLYALFNDRHVHFLEDEKRRLLTGGPAGRPRLYLFGTPRPDLAAAIRDSAFADLVVALARHGRVAAEAVEPPSREAWLAAGLLAAEDEWLRPGPTLLVVPRRAEAEAVAATAPHLDRYLALVAEAVLSLRGAYEETAAARRWSWAEVADAVVAGMLLDLAVGREFGILGAVRRHSGDSVVWAFEHLSADQGVGVAWVESGAGDWAAAQLWHPAVRRRPVRLTPAMVDLLGRTALGTAPPAGADVLYLRHARVLVGKQGGGAGVELGWPVFVPADAARLSVPLAHAADRIFRQAVVPALDALAQRPWWRRRGGDPSYRHAGLRLLLSYACQRVYGELLAEPPAEVAESWGRWLWLGRRGDALPRSGEAAVERAGVESSEETDRPMAREREEVAV